MPALLSAKRRDCTRIPANSACYPFSRTNVTGTEGGANEARVAPDRRAGIWGIAERPAVRGTAVRCGGFRCRAAERQEKQEKQEQEGCAGRDQRTLDDERR